MFISIAFVAAHEVWYVGAIVAWVTTFRECSPYELDRLLDHVSFAPQSLRLTSSAGDAHCSFLEVFLQKAKHTE
jgi:hypothetical protein